MQEERKGCIFTNLVTAHGFLYRAFNFLLQQGLWQAGMSSSATTEMPFPICLSSTTKHEADPHKGGHGLRPALLTALSAPLMRWGLRLLAHPGGGHANGEQDLPGLHSLAWSCRCRQQMGQGGSFGPLGWCAAPEIMSHSPTPHWFAGNC